MASLSSDNTEKQQTTSLQDPQTDAASAKDSATTGKDAPASRNVASVPPPFTTPDPTPALTATPNPPATTSLLNVLTAQVLTSPTQMSAKHSKPYETPTKTGRWKNSCNDCHTQPPQSQNYTTQLQQINYRHAFLPQIRRKHRRHCDNPRTVDWN